MVKAGSVAECLFVMNTNNYGIHSLPTPPKVSRLITQHYPVSDPIFASVDKTAFFIRSRVLRNLLKDPENFARKSDLPKRSIKRHSGGAISLIHRDPLLLAAYTPPGWVSPRTDAFPSYCR